MVGEALSVLALLAAPGAVFNDIHSGARGTKSVAFKDHRSFIKDLDKIWPTTRACKQLGTSEILTLTSAIKMSLASTLRDMAQSGGMPRRKVLAAGS